MATTTAATVRAEIARRQIRHRDIANALGLAQSAISRRINGETPWSAEQLQQLAELMHVPVALLYGEQVSA